MDSTRRQMLAEEDGFRYEVATEEFADAIVTVLSESFSREPMSAALGFSARDLEPIVTSFMPECTTNGLSVVAVPVDDTDTLAGVFICRDFKSPMPDSIPGDVRFSPVGAALMTVDEMYEAKRPGSRSAMPWTSGWWECRRAVDSRGGASRAHSFASAQTSLAVEASSAA